MMKTRSFGVFIISIVLVSMSQLSCKKTHLTNDFCDCSNSQAIHVIDTIALVVPNLFTPNGDGHNDVWLLQNIDKFPDSEVKVTRPGLFGGTVFEASPGSSTNWDGLNMSGNKLLKEGKYRYEIRINNEIFTGYVCIYQGYEQYDCVASCITTHGLDPAIVY